MHVDPVLSPRREPFPIEAARDLLGVVRGIFAAAVKRGAGKLELARIERAGSPSRRCDRSRREEQPGNDGPLRRVEGPPTLAGCPAFEAAAALAGPHRYGNPKARVFVQANSGLSLDGGKKVRAIVDAL